MAGKVRKGRWPKKPLAPLAVSPVVWQRVDAMLEKYPEIRKYLADGIAYSAYADNVDMVLELARRNRLRLMLVSDGDRVWGVAALEKKNSMHVSCIGGRCMSAWLPMLEDAVVKQARIFGKKFCTGAGRKGWERVMKPYGWKMKPDGKLTKYVGTQVLLI